MYPEMNYVDSSHIEAIGYLPDTLELFVQFKDGGIYVYLNVPPELYEEFMMAGSKGIFLNQCIKNVFSFEKR